MKKNIILFAALFISTAAFSQVGINTSTPEGVFHIDSKKNNNNIASTSTTVADDVVVSNTSGKEGNVGLGTKDPSVKLEIQTGGTSSSVIPGFKLVDGTQNTNYILTSDANGVARWEKGPTLKVTIGEKGGQGAYIPYMKTGGGVWYATGTYIDLPVGKWLVTAYILIQIDNSGGTNLDGNTIVNPLMSKDQWLWVRSTFTTTAPSGSQIPATGTIPTQPMTSAGNIPSSPIYPTKISGLYAGNSGYQLVQGTVYINNTTSGTQRYYQVVGDIQPSISSADGAPNIFWNGTTTTGHGIYLKGIGGNWSENLIYAVPIFD